MDTNQRIGVLLMSYGTPVSQDDILPFYTDVRRGRPPTPEQLTELSDRYAMIGGLSPLTERTLAQVKKITDRLEELYPEKYFVLYATKHSKPAIEEAVKGFADEGITAFIGMVFAPHYSQLSIGEYMTKAQEAASRHGIECQFIKSFALDEALIEFLSNQILSQVLIHATDIRKAENDTSASKKPSRMVVLITAHSLPATVISMGDPYPEQLRSTAEKIARQIGLGSEYEFIPLFEMADRMTNNVTALRKGFYAYTEESDIEIGWQIAWQSAGRTSQTWLGPDILEVLSDMGERGIRNIIICPAGFMSDHLEVLYDIDIAAQDLAGKISVSLSRTRSVNDDISVMNSLAQLIHDTSLTEKE
ncbi:MAG: ferrochelatase [Firmicutes bacterium]|nr:ferrochelatase [Bacillota bacterium]